MSLLDLLIIAVYFGLVHFGHLGITAFTLMVLTIVLMAGRAIRGERLP